MGEVHLAGLPAHPVGIEGNIPEREVREVHENELHTRGVDRRRIIREFSFEGMVFFLLTGRTPTSVDAFEAAGNYPQRRQSFEPLYLRNGATYASRASVIEGGSLWGPDCLAYLMPEERSININTEFQFSAAKLLTNRHGER